MSVSARRWILGRLPDPEFPTFDRMQRLAQNLGHGPIVQRPLQQPQGATEQRRGDDDRRQILFEHVLDRLVHDRACVAQILRQRFAWVVLGQDLRLSLIWMAKWGIGGRTETPLMLQDV